MSFYEMIISKLTFLIQLFGIFSSQFVMLPKKCSQETLFGPV